MNSTQPIAPGARLRILLDGMNLALPQGTGVATYARGVCQCARSVGHHVSVLYGRGVAAHPDPVLREAAFFDGAELSARPVARYLRDLALALRPLRPDDIPRTGHVLREPIADRLPECDAILNFPRLFLTARSKFEWRLGMVEIDPPQPIDVAHWTYPVPIRVRGAHNVYAVHDLVPLRMPYATLDGKKRTWELLRMIVDRADAIATVSETSRRDIVGMLGADPDRVVNTSQCASLPAEVMAMTDDDLRIELRAIAEAVGRPVHWRDFLLYVGAIEPKKNLDRMIAAYLASDVAQPLVVVGREAWSSDDVMRTIRSSPRIIYLDYLPRRRLGVLMRSARALLFASLYEGFGLPVIEAFLGATPVLTSCTGATAEIAGDAALLVDPCDVRSMRDGIRTLCAEDSEPLRVAMAARGSARAADFGVEPVAERLDDFYRGVLAREARR
jgi:glycosyltransferase involved in cell wall biosynthesis